MSTVTRGIVFSIALATACSGGDGTTRDASVDVYLPDAPYVVPTLTSFVPSPTTITGGVPTLVTWNWTFLTEPPIPLPVCTINNGVGEVTRGQMTMVTITQTTTFRLSCANAAGMTARDTVISVPLAAPAFASFTATPSAVAPNAATNVTFAWTFANSPSPAPTCTIDGTTAVSGTATSVNLPQARTYRLRCTNTQGTTFRDVTVAVNECGTASAQCDTNATCTDTVESYTCACNGNYVAVGDTCSAIVGSCGSCDQTNATCVVGINNQCVCNAGYVGSGVTCAKQRIMFTTSVQGNGDLDTWADAGANQGLAAADAICNARAAALIGAGAGSFVAWMSDDANDAYCRVNGFTGEKATNCGQGALPVAAGPWIRPPLSTAAGRPVAPTIDQLVAPSLATYYSMGFTETGAELALTDRVLTGTDENGVATANNCGNWGSSSFTLRGSAGLAHGGGTTWTHDTAAANDPLCDTTTFRLRCVEKVAGPALPLRRPTNVKRVFLTSVSGNGQLTSWPDAAGTTTGFTAADEICRARARYAGYTNASVFKAWFTGYASYIYNRIFNTLSSNYTRPDGVIIGVGRTDLYSDSKLAAAWYQTETGAYAAGNTETGAAWTGFMTSSGQYSNVHCGPTFSSTSWLNGTTAYSGTFGRFDLLDGRYINFNSQLCDQTARLYCVEDQ